MLAAIIGAGPDVDDEVDDEEHAAAYAAPATIAAVAMRMGFT
jgi:hypothetical protein